MSTGAAGSLAATLDRAAPDVRHILDRALDGAEVSVDDGMTLAHTTGRDLQALTIAADDEYVLYVNGKRLASGANVKRLDEFDLSEHLVKGSNVIAVQATNKTGSTAALVARLMVKEKDSGWTSYCPGSPPAFGEHES